MPSLILDTERVADAILSIIERYRLKTRPFDENIVHQCRNNFLPYLMKCVEDQVKIRLVLPAFPFKSPNNVDKVLGNLPDKAEEVSLALLQGLCDAIQDVYPPGASLVLVSDGIVYNDLLGVPDAIVWKYGETLRAMAAEYKSIKFARLVDLIKTKSISSGLVAAMNEDEYEEQAPLVRAELIAAYGDQTFDVADQIASNPNVKATYLGYIRFLMKDLAYSSVDGTSSDSTTSSDSMADPYFPPSASGKESDSNSIGSRRSQKKRASKVAKQMLFRGDCFARLIKDAFLDSVRLSIHASNSPSKISISVLPNCENLPSTPWHCLLACSTNGQMYPATRDDMTKTDEIEPVFRDGIPWCYREKSPLYHWDGIDVEFEHLYPSGLLIKANKPCTSYSEVPMKKLRALAEQNSPVVLRNFIGADSEDVFVSKASEMGEIQSWKFGHILRVKDGGNNNGGLNNVLSREPMPFHYDGLFKIVNGVSSPPRFQMFVAFTSTPKTLGRTLFSSSRLFISHLQTNHDISESTLRELTWSVRTASFDAAKWENLPLIIDHPSTGKPALRYHENWPKEKTQFDGSIVRFDDVDADEDERLRAAIDTALYDRRVCIRVAWEKGDVIVSDNVSMMHTREGFDSNEKRELWRVHVD